MSKPFSQACENNKAPILSHINQYFNEGITVLEIGSYTAQHIRYFADKQPGIIWQPSEIPDNISLLEAGLEGVASANILAPLVLDVSQHEWPVVQAGGIFSANTLHIMAQAFVDDFFRGAGEVLEAGGFLCVYGPFKYNGDFTSESNAGFELWLKERDQASGIRDFEKVNMLAQQHGMMLIADHAMPANNQLLVWQKEPAT